MALVKLQEVRRWFGEGESRIMALDGVTLEIGEGEFVAVTGPSGCGKSTLLHLLGGLDRPSEGTVEVGGLDLRKAMERDRTEYRRRTIGMVFQFFNLVPSLTVLENVELPLLLQGLKVREARERAQANLERVGMADRTGHFPHQLSGGQMQRAAIARALVHRPKLLLADEPTGNLDSENAELVLETFSEIARESLCTQILVTHSEEVARRATRRVRMRDGKIETG